MSTKAKYSSKYHRATKATIVLASSLASKTGDSTVDTDRAYSNKRGRKNKYGCNAPTTVGRVCAKA